MRMMFSVDYTKDRFGKYTEEEFNKVVSNLSQYDPKTVTDIQLILIDPIYAPIWIKPDRCEYCDSYTYELLNVNTHAHIFTICDKCIQKHFVDMLKSPVDEDTYF